MSDATDTLTTTPAPSEAAPAEAAALDAAPVEAVAVSASSTEAAPLVIDGVVITPETHRFKDGKPLFGKNGKPLRRPGPAKGSAPKAPKTATTPDAPAATVSTLTVANTDAPALVAPATTPVAAPVEPQPVIPLAAAALTPTLAPPAAPAPVLIRPATAVVTRVYGKIGAPESKNEELEVRSFVTEPAVVEIGYGLTLNIGNYESARVDVKLTLPCYAEEANAAYDFAKKWAEERVQGEVKEIRKIASGTKGSGSPF